MLYFIAALVNQSKQTMDNNVTSQTRKQNLVVNNVQFSRLHSVNFQHTEFSLRVIWANNVKPLQQHQQSWWIV